MVQEIVKFIVYLGTWAQYIISYALSHKRILTIENRESGMFEEQFHVSHHIRYSLSLQHRKFELKEGRLIYIYKFGVK